MFGRHQKGDFVTVEGWCSIDALDAKSPFVFYTTPPLSFQTHTYLFTFPTHHQDLTVL